VTFLTADDLEALACPACLGTLAFEGREVRGRLVDGTLRCGACARVWAVHDGVARLLDDARVAGMDRLLRPVYDLIAPFHDLGVDYLLPILQFPDLGATRDRYVERLALDRLRPRADGRPLRVLEVGVGSGANLPLLEAVLPPELDVDVWGMDFSTGMLGQCRRNLARTPPRRRPRLLLGDAHALPFRDHAFDRVFHVGAINGYHDRRQALAEMARVARPDTPIVVVDEGLDPTREHSLYHHLTFRALTLYDPDPRAPRAELPEGATDVEVTAVSRFYYCLRFTMPPPAAS
jgi:ubiquinone/menaquinone biosynthesis C-methylase UbiE